MSKKVSPTVSSVTSNSKKPSSKKGPSKVTQKKIARKSNNKSQKSKILVLTEPTDNDSISLSISINHSTVKVFEPINEKPTKSDFLSRYTSTLISDKNLGITARISGILFIVLGASFSTFNLQSAITAGTTPSELQASLTVGDMDDVPATQIVAPEHVQIDINTTDADQVSKVHALIHTNFPHKISVIVMNKETKQSIPVGYAMKVSEETWSIFIERSTLLTGTYYIKAVLSRDQISQTYISQDSFTVEKEEQTDISGTPTAASGSFDQDHSTIQSTTTDESEVEDESDEVGDVDKIVILDEEPLSELVPVALLSRNISKPVLYARNKTTNILYFAGKGVPVQDGEWGVTWNTKLIPNGKYVLMARDQDNTRQYLDHTVTVAVLNKIFSTKDSSDITTQSEQQESAVYAQPRISIQDFKSPVNNYVRVTVNADFDASSAELYLLPQNSDVPTFLGSLRKSTYNWMYDWDTRNTPNGKYSIYARLTRGIQSLDSNLMSLQVSNAIVHDYSKEQEEFFSKTSSAQEELTKINTEKDDEYPTSTIYIESLEGFIRDSIPEEDRSEIEVKLADYKMSFENYRNEYARLIRSNDHDRLPEIEKRITEMQDTLLNDLPSITSKQEVIDDVQRYIGESSHAILEITKKNETIIRERIGEIASKDDDKDSITNYDEVNLYKTDPFSADTDGDGFLDGDEIVKGYDPLLSVREATVEYQSPKESGVVRDDILQIVAIETIATSEDQEASTSPKALITGRALPNSFVTLYIFSTPVVVTVKTNADGNWTYVFDKDIEDGEHEIYIGLTDNTGQIVARSEPFTFVKTAEAFETSAELSPVVNITSTEPSLIYNRTMLVIASLAVVGLGLVLLLLGIHVQTRHPELLNAQSA